MKGRGPVLRRQLVAAGGSAGAVQGSLTYPLDLVTPPTRPSFPSPIPSLWTHSCRAAEGR